MPYTDTSKSQAANRTSCHASHRYLQITGNKSCFLPCFTQIPANHRQQIVHLAMPHTDTIKSQATNRTSYHASHRYQQITGSKSYILQCLKQIPSNHRQQVVHLVTPHTNTSKSQATNRTSYHASCRYQQTVHLAMPHIDASNSQAANRTSYHASHRYQQSQATNRTSYHASHRYQKNHRQQIVHLAMPDTDTCKPQTTNRTSYHASHRYQQITGDKAFILPCLTQIPANHRQQMPHTDTSKSWATNRKSCHTSHRYQQVTGNK